MEEWGLGRLAEGGVGKVENAGFAEKAAIVKSMKRLRESKNRREKEERGRM